MDLRERVGTVVGENWQIDREIGHGGTATVYAASHRMIGTRVALKLLNEEAAEDEDAHGRFLREAMLTSRVDHEGVVRVIDTGATEDGLPFFVMELLAGETLDERRKKRDLERLSIEETLRVSLVLADILAAAHDAGIVHRDVKPANVFLTKQGGVKLLDFGVAGAEQQHGHVITGAGCGTPLYMAPEQITGKRPIDARSDIYALGATMYRLLSGRHVYDAQTLPEYLHKMFSGNGADRLDDIVLGVDAALADVVERALSIDADERFADARSMKAAILRAMNSRHENADESASELGTGDIEVISLVSAESREPFEDFRGDTLVMPTSMRPPPHAQELRTAPIVFHAPVSTPAPPSSRPTSPFSAYFVPSPAATRRPVPRTNPLPYTLALSLVAVLFGLAAVARYFI
jgi:serine/threonine protein kinase